MRAIDRPCGRHLEGAEHRRRRPRRPARGPSLMSSCRQRAQLEVPPAVACKRFFRRLLEQSIDGLRRAACDEGSAA